MEVLQVAKNVRESKFQVVSEELESKKKFLERITHNISEADSSFHVN